MFKLFISYKPFSLEFFLYSLLHSDFIWSLLASTQLASHSGRQNTVLLVHNISISPSIPWGYKATNIKLQQKREKNIHISLYFHIHILFHPRML